jgi:hypothetical protein
MGVPRTSVTTYPVLQGSKKESFCGTKLTRRPANSSFYTVYRSVYSPRIFGQCISLQNCICTYKFYGKNLAHRDFGVFSMYFAPDLPLVSTDEGRRVHKTGPSKRSASSKRKIGKSKKTLTTRGVSLSCTLSRGKETLYVDSQRGSSYMHLGIYILHTTSLRQ